ncbi:FtsX-like permease family protein, partial [candidate division WWE3 bacterium]|nr:FtsX-like permease family protein [candidate division WWE3 bacterium]
ANFQNLSGVAQVLPQISLVGRVSFQNSNTDVAVYGVTTNYLTQSAIQPTAGTVFDSNDLTIPTDESPTSFNQTTTENLSPEELALSALENSHAVLAEEDTADTIDLSEIDPEAQANEEEQITLIQLGDSALKKAVVNRSFLRVLGIAEAEAVGKNFETTFVVVGSLLDNPEQKVETYPSQYEIVGVTSEDDAPFFYVPFIDLRGIGVSNYSQVKVVVQNQDVLANVRRQIEAMGYLTSSVVDTVSQIDSLFSTLRVVLAVVGLVAVAIAALGMFNTLTVSLLERTREVGFMKALGMKSHEIRDLFLTESLLMGIFGGIFGLAFGHFAGLGVNLLLSIISWSQGGDYIDVSYIPPSLLTVVIILSFFVGVFTGYYPAHRATNISALNALRYE